MRHHNYCVYILTNKNKRVLYTGVTSNLEARVVEHQTKALKGFTSRYNVDRLVYYEYFSDIEDAIAREKQIKAGARAKKVSLIEGSNPAWKDLSEEW
jgi:putative endonuclease